MAGIAKTSKQDTPLDPFTRDEEGAWTHRHGGLILKSAFQPIFTIENELLEPVACESLLRIFSNDQRVMPSSFFNSLNTKQRIDIESTTRAMHLRNAAFLHSAIRRIFVNFDPSIIGKDQSHETLFDEMGQHLSAVDLSPADVVCEITEQAIADSHQMKTFVYGLRARGFRIAVDDFGAQASNRARVAQLTPDLVKIDGKMVQRMFSSVTGYGALKRLIDEFQNDGIRVVLEGIEHSWHIPLAINSGADFFQGFALAVPKLAPAFFDEWLDRPARKRA